MAAALICLAACDDTTDTIGSSLTDHVDQFDILTDTFAVSSRSLAVDSVLSRSVYSYLGNIKDPETGTYVRSNFTTQFAVLEDISGTAPLFPDKDSLTTYRSAEKEIRADSCSLQIYIYSSVGDSLCPMKLTAYELDKPIEDGRQYYSNYDPEAQGLLRKDFTPKSKVYTSLDLNLKDSLRSLIVDKTNMESITVPLGEYTDRDGVTYDNYGTYLMRKYYAHPEMFKNSYEFIHNVCPGFYVKNTGGLGVMSEIYLAELLLYYRVDQSTSKADSIATVKSFSMFSGTEEVMQATNIVNDKEATARLAADNTCTYLKTPAGIYTEVELPVDDIMRGHESDTISSAKIVFNKIREKNADSSLGVPTSVLMVPKDSMYSFFEHRDLPDSKSSYLSVYSESAGTYTFNNISTLVTSMAKARKEGTANSENWNKVVLVPVTVTSSTQNSSTTVTSVANSMQITGTRLAGGSANAYTPLTISVVYNRFKKD